MRTQFKFFVAFLLVTLWPMLASGKELTFKFDIYSSGPMMYACNAGLRHVRTATQVCHYANLPATPDNTCTPGSVVGTGAHNCECTSVNGGDYLMDFMRFKYSTWQGGMNGTHLTNNTNWNAFGWNPTVTSGVAQAWNGSDTYAQVLNVAQAQAGNSINPLAVRLDQVTFDLGSELYGSEFFLDVCFRGSQIDYFYSDPVLNATSSNAAAAAITVSDVDALGTGETSVGPGGVAGTSLAYLNLSGLRTRATIACDQQGIGTYPYGHNGTNYGNPMAGTYDTLYSDLSFATNGQSVIGDMTYNTSNWITPTAQASMLFGSAGNSASNFWVNLNNSNHPRFCVVRYWFKESNLAQRSWQRNDARVVTWTKIEEAAGSNN